LITFKPHYQDQNPLAILPLAISIADIRYSIPLYGPIVDIVMNTNGQKKKRTKCKEKRQLELVNLFKDFTCDKKNNY